MARNTPESAGDAAARRAMILIAEAMDLLDAHGASPDAAAHLDLALQCIRRSLSGSSPEEQTRS